MKEATGELNMTVVTVVAIGAVMLFFYAIIWPTIKINMALTTACNSAGAGSYNVSGDDYKISCGGGSCTYTDSDGKTNNKTCTENR